MVNKEIWVDEKAVAWNQYREDDTKYIRADVVQDMLKEQREDDIEKFIDRLSGIGLKLDDWGKSVMRKEITGADDEKTDDTPIKQESIVRWINYYPQGKIGDFCYLTKKAAQTGTTKGTKQVKLVGTYNDK